MNGISKYAVPVLLVRKKTQSFLAVFVLFFTILVASL